MSIQLNKHAYEDLIIGDIVELIKHMPEHSLEKKHAIEVLKWSIKQIYPDDIWKKKPKCTNCNGEGYLYFVDQGEPDLNSVCVICRGTGKKEFEDIPDADDFDKRLSEKLIEINNQINKPNMYTAKELAYKAYIANIIVDESQLVPAFKKKLVEMFETWWEENYGEMKLEAEKDISINGKRYIQAE